MSKLTLVESTSSVQPYLLVPNPLASTSPIAVIAAIDSALANTKLIDVVQE
jgi:hypothetical protein